MIDKRNSRNDRLPQGRRRGRGRIGARALGLGLLLALGGAEAAALPAFPGAEGWGAETPGGRGADPAAHPPKVYVVTTLASYGPGSLNEALRAQGPRIIVFRVSGVIDLQPSGTMNEWYISGDNAYVTIAGQTSPGGITLISSGNATSTLFAYKGGFHDAVFRFLRFRARKHNEDALTLSTSSQFIIDHCDFSGGSDETLDLSQNHHWTVQWSTIANSSEGQTYGFLIANYTDGHRFSIHHNLLANHVYRFPEMHWKGNVPPDKGLVDYRNNVCYNGEDYFLFADKHGTEAGSVNMNIVGNTFKAGPQSPPNAESDATWFLSMVHLADHIVGYAEDNVMIPRSGAANRTRVSERLAARSPQPFPMAAVTTHSADSAYALVLAKAGAWPRDAMSLRTVNEVRTGTGQFRKDDDALIGAGPTPPPDADLDGMPDAWEKAMGLDPNSAADNVKDLDGDGYLNIEEYVNDLASAMLGEPVQNPGARPSLPTPALAAPAAPRGFRAAVEGGRLRISLPGTYPAGRLEILDIRGRRLATLPARAETAWEPEGGAGALPVCVRWLKGNGEAETAQVVAPGPAR